MLKKISNSMLGQVGIVLMAVSLLSACSFNQDPYADKPDQIRKGVPPELDREPPLPKPLASDALRIDALDFYSFKEGVPGEVQISGRVLSSNPQFELSVDNTSLQDFPGATFDTKTGIFKWTPPRESTGMDYGVAKRLVVRLTAPSPAGGAIIGTTKAILVYVTRAEVDPSVVAIEDLTKDPVREGELRKFNITVNDPDSLDVDGMRPTLVTIPTAKGPSDISGLIYMLDSNSSNPNPVQDPSNKKQWIFRMALDLRTVSSDGRGRDFTRGSDLFKFGVKVTSRFGRTAVSNSGQAQIWTDVMKPEVSWFDPITVVAGQENLIQFMVYDPYSEGTLTVNLLTRIDIELGAASTWRCIAASREGNVLCKLNWKPINPTKTEYPIEFEVMNKSKIPNDTNVKKETFKRIIKVIVPATPAVPSPAVPSPTVPHPSTAETEN